MSLQGAAGNRPTVVLVGALPPPFHGMTVMIDRILRSRVLAERFEVVHADISDERDMTNIGRWDPVNVRLALVHWWRLLMTLVRHRPALVHLPLSQNYLGLFRDWILLVTALTMPRTNVIGHIGGGGFAEALGRAPPWFRRLVLPAVRRCAALIVSSEWHRGRIQRMFPRARLEIVRQGTESIDGARRPSTQGGLRVLFANSALTEDKGFFHALEAAAMCERRLINAHWTFVGSFLSPAEQVRATTMMAGLGSVQIVGPLEREALLERYRDADVFVFPPSPQEGFGLVRVEAMAAGLPIITTAAGGANEVIDDGREGFIVSYGSPDQIADRIWKLEIDPSLRSQMGRHARARQREHFSIQALERMLTQAWLDALNG